MSSDLPEGSDPILALMKMFEMPMTLEKYLELNFGPDTQFENLTAEQLSEVPDSLLKAAYTQSP